MCGTSLEPKRPVGAPRVTSAVETARTAPNAAAESRTPIATRATIDADDRVPPSAGPSFLGLNQPFTNEPNRSDRTPAFREQSFSGMDSFYEADDPNIGVRRIVLLLLLLGILGAGGWWTYSNYDKMGAALKRNPQTATAPQSSDADNASSNPKSSTDTASSPNAGSSPAAAPGAAPAAQSANSNPVPASESKPDQPKAEQAQSNQKADQPNAGQGTAANAQAAEPERPSRPATTARSERASAREARPAQRPSPAVASDDKGDAEFRRGEAYLYGRGAGKNCDEAVKNLKAASAKQNAKARSTFGTMYATGHCVPRDLPTSYTWFARALRADPNNQILEKDLVAVWNQMTPPERQMATRSKQ